MDIAKDDNDDEMLMMGYHTLKRRRRRRMWVHEINSNVKNWVMNTISLLMNYGSTQTILHIISNKQGTFEEVVEIKHLGFTVTF